MSAKGRFGKRSPSCFLVLYSLLFYVTPFAENTSVAAGIEYVATGIRKFETPVLALHIAGHAYVAAGAKCVATGPKYVAAGATYVSTGPKHVAVGAKHVATGPKYGAVGATYVATGPKCIVTGAKCVATGA